MPAIQTIRSTPAPRFAAMPMPAAQSAAPAAGSPVSELDVLILRLEVAQVRDKVEQLRRALPPQTVAPQAPTAPPRDRGNVAPVVPRQPAVTPAPAPSAPSRPAASPSTAPAPVAKQAPTLDLPGLKVGSRFTLDPNTQIAGYSVTGSAQVTAFDGKSLDLLLDASAMMGMVKRRLAVHCTTNSNGTLRIVARELDAQGKPGTVDLDDTFQILKNQPGNLSIRDNQGRAGALQLAANGTLSITSATVGNITMHRA